MDETGEKARRPAIELDIRHVRQTYARPSGAPLLVLDDINLTLREGEMVGLLGAPAAESRRCCASSPDLRRRPPAKCLYRGRPSMARRRESQWSSRPSPCFPG